MRLNRVCRNAAIVSLVGLSAGIARAQDFYDTSVLRTVNIQFHDANWLALLKANYAAQVNILADLTIDNVTYPSVGVRIRGNTSYTALPAGSEKFSINIDTDAVDPNQEITGGYSSLNFNNGFHDPTFCREVLYNNYVASFMPNMRANHVIVTLNGQNWGVYNNIQQFNKKMLSTHFPDTSGLRIKCANNPAGPGLRYNGATASGYTGYEIKDDGGLADPWAAHIAVCNALTNANTANWQTTIDPIFAVDPSIWSVVFENILTDDDSYVNKGADFMTYRNPTDGRTYLLQTDANETFTQTTWSPTLNFTQTTKPFLSRVLAVPELRQRYFAHYRTAKADLNWAFFGPTATELRTQIDAAVNADPKKLYSYTLFNNNFTASVTMPYSGPAGGTIPGLQPFLTARTSSLNSIAEMAATGPVISSVTPSNATPDPIESVTITAAVAPSASGAISKVELWYRPSPAGTYQRTPMSLSAPGQYSVVLPVVASPGQQVNYYVAATTANSYNSLSFSPTHTEWTPLSINYTFAASGGMRITEFMYSGASGEFVEFTNMSSDPIDLTGWSFDDDHAVAGALSLSSLGTVAPGESVVITEAVASTFRTAWNLDPSVKVLGGVGTVGVGGNNLARNDQINLYNASGTLVDRLRFGDQTYTGTIRTQNASGQVCRDYIGDDAVASWVLSTVGDAYGSVASTGNDKGSPGHYVSVRCSPCPGDLNGDGPIDDADFVLFASAYNILDCADPSMPANCPADLNDDGFVDDADFVVFVAAYDEFICP
ncbi:MAG: CotH kinase family protein [Phycisphaerae bacterium]|nr:CotH kinase family protein [Phycisphaerae bacterium]